MRSKNLTACGLAVVLLTAVCQADDAPQAGTFGWRGNWTGLYPAADPPVEWGRTSNGVLAGMTCQAARPADAAKSGQPVEKGLLRDWLVIGPFAVANSAQGLAQEQILGEAQLAPAAGDKAGELVWRQAEIKKKPNYEVWGTTRLDALDPGEILGFKPNSTVYAFTNVFVEREGKAVMVVDHAHGLKVRLNGAVVYDNPNRGGALGNYVGITEAPNDVFGKLMSIPDDLMPNYYRLLLGYDDDATQALVADIAAGKLHPRRAKGDLAQAIIARYHDAAAAQAAEAEFDRIFAQKQVPTDMPEVVVSAAEMSAGGIGIVALVVLAGHAESNGEARRLLRQGAVTINGERVADENAQIIVNEGDVLQVGKRKFARVTLA